MGSLGRMQRPPPPPQLGVGAPPVSEMMDAPLYCAEFSAQWRIQDFSDRGERLTDRLVQPKFLVTFPKTNQEFQKHISP